MNSSTTKKHAKTRQFLWQGVNQENSKTAGELEATTLLQAKVILRQRGVRVTHIKPRAKPLFAFVKPIKAVDICFASRQMSTMIGAGIPIAQTLRGIGKGHEKKSMETLMYSLAKDVESGSALSHSLAKHPQIFSPLFTSLTQAGEESGRLDVMLDKVATYNEKSEAIKSKVKSAMMYPSIVFFIAGVVTVLLLLFVIPKFEVLFQGINADLPRLTRIVVGFSEWMQTKWWLFVAASLAFIIGLNVSYKHSPKFRLHYDRLKIKLPIIGPILAQTTLARFARTLSIFFSAGVPLADSMGMVAAVTGNRVYSKSIQNIKNSISTGHSLESAMSATELFPNMMLQMVAGGEESGELEIMLDKVADFYEQEVDNSINALESIIEPLMIVILGIIIGIIILAMYMPIFKMASTF